MINGKRARKEIKDVLGKLLEEYHTQKGASQLLHEATIALLKTVSHDAAEALKRMADPIDGKSGKRYLLWAYEDQGIMRYVGLEDGSHPSDPRTCDCVVCREIRDCPGGVRPRYT